MNRDVTTMTKGELFHAINDEARKPNSDLAFIATCIKEEDRRINEYIKQCIKEERNAG
ncbi:MAG: hypothetical protein FWD35_01850 [Oscillospiraceae bacterium]|nr:hypothetical protein [Oscillospiraceae bacterium]